jgi:hypothetical protein
MSGIPHEGSPSAGQKRPGRAARPDAGMLLLETMVYIGVLAVILNVALSIFISASRLSLMGTTALDRLCMVEEVRQVFSRGAHEAQAVAPGIGAYKTGPDQVVFELPSDHAAEGERRYVVFGRIISPARLSRMEIVEKDGQFSLAACSTYALPVSALQFGFPGDDPGRARLVSVELDVPNAGKTKPKPPVTYRFLAALRGRVGHTTGAAMP